MFAWFLMGLLLGLLMRDVSGCLTSCVLRGIRSRKSKREIKDTIKQLEDHVNED